MATSDYFLKIDGIDGESQDSKHKNEIDVLDFSWGATQLGTSLIGGGSGAGKVSMRDFSFEMKVNKSSPKLLLHCANGQHIKKAVLTARKAGGKQVEFYKITMEDLLVSSYKTNGKYGSYNLASSGNPDGTAVGSAGANLLIEPTDRITLNFSRIKFEYAAQKADGTLDGYISTGYDLKAQTSQ